MTVLARGDDPRKPPHTVLAQEGDAPKPPRTVLAQQGDPPKPRRMGARAAASSSSSGCAWSGSRPCTR